MSTIDILKKHNFGYFIVDRDREKALDQCAQEIEGVCEWVEKKYRYDTSCGNSYLLPEHEACDTPNNPDFKYCPYCSKKIKAVGK